jgi:hypothetical protein
MKDDELEVKAPALPSRLHRRGQGEGEEGMGDGVSLAPGGGCPFPVRPKAQDPEDPEDINDHEKKQSAELDFVLKEAEERTHVRTFDYTRARQVFNKRARMGAGSEAIEDLKFFYYVHSV